MFHRGEVPFTCYIIGIKTEFCIIRNIIGHNFLCSNINPVCLQANVNSFSPLTAGFFGYNNKKNDSSYNLPRRHIEGVNVYLHPSSNLGARWRMWLMLRSDRFTPGKRPRHPMYRGTDESGSRSWHVWKISLPPGFELRTLYSVVSRYTDYAIPNTILGYSLPNNTVYHELFSRIIAHILSTILISSCSNPTAQTVMLSE